MLNNCNIGQQGFPLVGPPHCQKLFLFSGDEILHQQGGGHVSRRGEETLNVQINNNTIQKKLQATYENPPHVYALADNMYRNMTIGLLSMMVMMKM